MAELCAPLPGFLDFAVRLTVLWICAGVLLAKKLYHETEERTWPDFLLDSSKQLLGAGWLYLLSTESTECTVYAALLLAQASAGLLIEYVMLTVLSRLFERGTENPRAFRTGQYRDEDGSIVAGFYVMQLVLWLTCLTCMKWSLPWVLLPYYIVADIALLFVAWSPHLELIAGALLLPCCTYALQVWVTDDFLKQEGAPGFVWIYAQEYLPASCIEWVEDILMDPGEAEEGEDQEEDEADVELGPRGDGWAAYEPPDTPHPTENGDEQADREDLLGLPLLKDPLLEATALDAPVVQPAKLASSGGAQVPPPEDSGRGVGPLDGGAGAGAGAAADRKEVLRRGTTVTITSAAAILAGDEPSPGASGSAAAAARRGGGDRADDAASAASSAEPTVEDIIQTAATAAAESAKMIFVEQVKGIKEVLSKREKDLKGLNEQLQRVLEDDELMQSKLSGDIRRLQEVVQQQMGAAGPEAVSPARATRAATEEEDVDRVATEELTMVKTRSAMPTSKGGSAGAASSPTSGIRRVRDMEAALGPEHSP